MLEPGVEDFRLPARSAERLLRATRELRRVLGEASDEAQLVDQAVRCAARLANAACASLWLWEAASFRRAAVFGDTEPEDAAQSAALRHLVAARGLVRRGARRGYLGVAIRWDGQLIGVLTVLRADRRFTPSEGFLLIALADVVAASLARVRAQALAAARAGDEHTQSEQQLRSIYEAIACGVTVWAPDGTLVHYNQTAEELMGVSLTEHVGRHLVGTVRVVRDDGTDAPPTERRVLTAARTGKAIRNYTSTVTRSDGETRFLQMNAVPVFGADGRPNQVVCSFVDFTERKRAEEQLAHQAHHDPLTGLPNRKLLLDRLQQAVLSAHQAALLLVDLDRFKEVNDTRGHHVGDELLIQVGARLRATLRSVDTISRLGGDEFAVLLPDGDLLTAGVVCDVLRRRLESPFTIEGKLISVGASIGIAIYPLHGTDAAALLRHADGAMYADKRRSLGTALNAG